MTSLTDRGNLLRQCARVATSLVVALAAIHPTAVCAELFDPADYPPKEDLRTLEPPVQPPDDYREFWTINTSTGGVSRTWTFAGGSYTDIYPNIGYIVAQSGGPHVAVFSFDVIDVPLSASVTIEGDRPAVLLSQTDVTIGGCLAASAERCDNDAGPLPPICVMPGEGCRGGPGGGWGGAGGAPDETGQNGGGLAGGDGGYFDIVGGARAGPGQFGATDYIDILRGGSGGGGGGGLVDGFALNAGGGGGGGGGGVELGALGQITFTTCTFTADGGWGGVNGCSDEANHQGGTGSGGLIRLHAPVISLDGYVSVAAGHSQEPHFCGRMYVKTTTLFVNDGVQIVVDCSDDEEPGGGEGWLDTAVVNWRSDAPVLELDAGGSDVAKILGLFCNTHDTSFDLRGPARVHSDTRMGALAGDGSADVEILEGAKLKAGYLDDSTSFRGDLHGGGQLVKVGAGKLTLFEATNTCAGGTWIHEGSIAIDRDHQLGDSLMVDNGTINTLRPMTVGVNVMLRRNDPGVTIYPQNADCEFSGDFTGPGGLRKTGADHALTLSGHNNYTGDTAVEEGTLRGDSDSLQGDITLESATAELVFDQSVPGTFTGTISGPGSVTKTGSGSLQFEPGALNSCEGGTTLAEGSLYPTRDDHLGAPGAALTFAGGTLAIHGTGWTVDRPLILNQPGGEINCARQMAEVPVILSEVVSGSGGLLKSGSGTLVLQAQNTYEGDTYVEGGTLAISQRANLGQASAALVLDGGTLRVLADANMLKRAFFKEGGGTIDTAGNSVTWGGPLDGVGRLTKAGPGVLHLTANPALTYLTGGMHISAGTVRARSSANLPGGSLVVDEAGAELVVTGELSLSQNVTGPESLTIVSGGEVYAASIEIDNTGHAELRLGGVLTTARMSASDDTFDFPGGILHVDRFYGNLVSGGVLAPGASIGTTEVHGDYLQLGPGTFEVEIANDGLTTSYDRLEVSQTAALGGELEVVLVDGFVPAVDEEFVIVTAPNRDGWFTNAPDTLDIGGCRAFDVEYTASTVVLRYSITEGATIAEQPVDFLARPGDTVRFGVLIEDASGQPEYQWTHDGADIPGATEATLTLQSVDPLDAGDYKVVVTDDCGTRESDPAMLWFDCNSNLTPDHIDISSQTIPDCHTDGVPDDCQLADNDCNSNTVPDECEVPPLEPAGSDCNGNLMPDECEPDCQPNEVPDECDLRDETSIDLNQNTLPDECEPEPCQASEVHKLLSFDAEAYEKFGTSVAIDGEVVAIGAPEEEPSSTGAVYVYRRQGREWVEEARLQPDSLATNSTFGASVDVASDLLIVGATQFGGAGYGMAYVFRFDGTIWVQEARWTNTDGWRADHLGHSVAIEGDVAVVTMMGPGTVRVYDYDDSDSAWSLHQTLDTPPAWSGGGHAAALDGDTLVIGWSGVHHEEGIAYVYRRQPGEPGMWVHEADLTASDGAASDYFGHSVAVSGDTILIGAWEDDGEWEGRGSAYVFDYDGSDWQQRVKLRPWDNEERDRFGSAVALDGETAVIGACNDANRHGSYGRGSAYVYQYDGSHWLEEAKLLPSGDRMGNVGWTVALSDGVAVVGAPTDTTITSGAGAAYIYSGISQCNEYERLDMCEVLDAVSPDCNQNLTPDTCDIASSASEDSNGNGYPDECEKAGDFDFDGDVDLDDCSQVIVCLSGPAIFVTPDCGPADTDNDIDVELLDFAAVQRSFTGEQ